MRRAARGRSEVRARAARLVGVSALRAAATTHDPEVPLTAMDNHDPALLQELLGAVEDVARTGAFTGGEFVERFERAFASSCGVDHAVGVASGTEALTLALRALGVAPGDEVIVPANSFIATAEAVCLAGATPRFADVDPDTQLVTAATLERAYGPRVRGVIPVHLFGRTVELAEILAAARARGLWVLEDCAQAVGARYEGRPVGSWGDAGAFSFYPAKNLGAWGDGGAVVTGRDELADRVSLLRSHGERPRYNHRMVGTTGRLDAVQAAVLAHKLPRLAGWNEARRRIAGSLREHLGGLEQVTAPAPPRPPGDHVYHQFVIRARDRDRLREHLAARGVASAIHYPLPIHRTEAFRGSLDSADPAPTATRLAGEICSLPIFPTMTSAQVARVAVAVREYDAGLG
jgi:dTDP-3-amino-3,4,6-trideoxy-alpha-D-glucose transaminase